MTTDTEITELKHRLEIGMAAFPTIADYKDALAKVTAAESKS